jgi:beta-lactam-binding protein with PASTA domain
MLDLRLMSSQQTANHPKAGSIASTITRRLAMVIVLALAFFLSATITIYTLFRIGDTRVPDCIGKPETEAKTLAEKAGLKVRIQPRNDPSVPSGTVIETKPGPNASVKKDSPLTIFVSSGPPGKSQNLRPDSLQQASRLQGPSAGLPLTATN